MISNSHIQAADVIPSKKESDNKMTITNSEENYFWENVGQIMTQMLN
jgi:hypothetical protein